jgi:DNA-binding CsgD family transcriptional regulator/catechol 2,3-dioxygenase-like lactoylglutathione lyase family enzyme
MYANLPEKKGRVNRGFADYYSQMARRRGRPPHDDLLTPAEWRTVYAVRHGLTNQQIADRRGISLDAVKYHVANAIAKLGVRNRKALKSWAGSHKESLLNAGRNVMNDDTKYFGVGQISRSVADVGAAEHWYRDVLGLDHLYTFGDLVFFDCGGTRVMLSQAEHRPDNESLVYLRVPDIDAAYERLTDNGVEFINAPHMIHKHGDGTEEWMAFFNDLEGRPLAIMSVVGSAEN